MKRVVTTFHPFRALFLVPIMILALKFEDQTTSFLFACAMGLVTGRIFPFTERHVIEDKDGK